MIDLRRLRLLSELARRGTIAEVARVVGYTPSAISQSLLQLEHEAGVPLLERDGRRVRLTPAAHGLVWRGRGRRRCASRRRRRHRRAGT
jgi:DNA-binding transcriptional LysR family regulator